MSHIGWPVPEPEVPAGTHPALADAVRAAAAAFGAARRQYDRAALAEKVADGRRRHADDAAGHPRRHRRRRGRREAQGQPPQRGDRRHRQRLGGDARRRSGGRHRECRCGRATFGVRRGGRGRRGRHRGAHLLVRHRPVLARGGRPADGLPHHGPHDAGRRCREPAASARPGRRRVVAGRETGGAGADPVDQLPGGGARRGGLDRRVRRRRLRHPPDHGSGGRDGDGARVRRRGARRAGQTAGDRPRPDPAVVGGGRGDPGTRRGTRRHPAGIRRTEEKP